jgi:hypothetical protein
LRRSRVATHRGCPWLRGGSQHPHVLQRRRTRLRRARRRIRRRIATAFVRHRGRHAVESSLDVDTSPTAREQRPWRTSPRGHCRCGPVAGHCVLPRSRSRSCLDPCERVVLTGQQRRRCVHGPLRFLPHLCDPRHCHHDDACNMTIPFATEIEPAEPSVIALPDLRCPIPGRQINDAAGLRLGLNARNVDRQGVSPEVRASKEGDTGNQADRGDKNVTGHHASLCGQIDS